MAFDSIDYLIFLAATALVYSRLPARWRRLYLLAVSYAFYLTWSMPCALLLAGATAIAYLSGLRLAKALERQQTAAIGLPLILLAGGLAFFKCFNTISHALAGHGAWVIVAPLGISYYTFKLMGYVIDVYWSRIPAQRDFLALAAYASFFPQIVSGPIQRPGDFLPQFGKAPASGDDIAIGMRLVLFGLFKKLVVADRLGVMVNTIYDRPDAYHGWPVLAAVYAFSIQLYADFSGLTDIAIGSARLFGITSPDNFKAPFYASNIQEFWRRWHMTLTSWLTDYVFTPLHTSLRSLGGLGLSVSILVTFLIIGAWHGIQGHYVAFGLINGIYMLVSAWTLSGRDRFFARHQRLASARRLFGPLLTFSLVTCAFVFFRAGSVSQAWAIFGNILGRSVVGPTPPSLAPYTLLVTGLAILVMEVLHGIKDKHGLGWKETSPGRLLSTICFYAILLVFLMFGRAPVAQKFIYFQF